MKEKETMSERVSVNEAARILGMSPTSVRFQMKKKTLPIGRAVPAGKERINPMGILYLPEDAEPGDREGRR